MFKTFFIRYFYGNIEIRRFTMEKIDYKEFEKRYDKFKKNNLPRDFWDEERQTLEFVYYDTEINQLNKIFMQPDEEFDRRLHVERSLTEALSDIAYTGFYYPYTCKYFTLPRVDDKNAKRDYIIELGHTHNHDFDSVVQSLYDFPESFKIEDDELVYYSKQELEYLRRVQKYLLFIGLKDLDSRKPKVDRFRNKRHAKYGGIPIHCYNEESLKDFLSGKRNFTVGKWYEGFENREYEDYYMLFADMEDNIKMYVKLIKKQEDRYDSIKDKFQDETLKDEDKVIITYFEIMEIFD